MQVPREGEFKMISLGLRIFWQLYPGLLMASLFWAWVLVFNGWSFKKKPRWWKAIVLIGALSNALVVLANGGYMPVTNLDNQISLWVPATDKHTLLFLADRYIGWSLGDFFILTGLGIGLVQWGIGKIRRGNNEPMHETP